MESFAGELWEGVLPGVLRQLYVGRATGRLLLERSGQRHGLRLSSGHILNAETNAREDRMGSLLVASGRLTEGDVKRATGFALRDGKRVGAVLVELGLLDADGLEEAVSRHVQHVLRKAFAWNDGRYEFHEETEGEARQGDVTLRLSTGELILQAARSVHDPDVVRYKLGSLDRRIALSNDPLLRFQHISLNPVDGYVLSRVDGRSSMRQIVTLIPLPEAEVHRSLFGLVCTGVIDILADEPKPARPGARRPEPPAPTGLVLADVPHQPPPSRDEKTQPLPALDQRRLEILGIYESLGRLNHFGLLGVGREASQPEISEAYARLARRFHPDGHHEPALSDLRAPLEAIFARLGQAYEVLGQPDSRARYERALSPAPRA